ncbi:hypothetical protein [Barnesiella sp. An55]|uniref:hypothetical protein n=1 Tax=Barnesiella sp. An55 TaxID=1965646 RepID=UPI000B36D331|nr:hypothetical protein [Barnesiella sp. An55]OUN71159.1 hypothetical protein B5G10_09400 [Barnesiella sp. An55]
MKLEIAYIKDSGNLEKERTVFKVTQPTNLGLYLVSQSVETSSTTFSSNIKNIYWLPDQELKIGDLVVLYTKKGEKRSTINKDGSTTYFYYWGLDKPLTSTEKSCVVLLETSWRVKGISSADNKTEK